MFTEDKVTKNERNAKGKFTFLFIFEQKMQLMCIKNYQKKKMMIFLVKRHISSYNSVNQ